LHRVINESDLDESLKIQLKSLDFSLLNRYSRRYYRSACGNFRITIDKDLSYYKLNHMSNNFVQDVHDTDALVLELKYAQDKDDIADKITAYFPFRMTKNSKYVNGVDYLNYQ
jgi:VTC domain.